MQKEEFPIKLFEEIVSFAGKTHNVVKIAVARELACFILGMMTENIK